jgi:hypothetical protein
MAVSVVGSDSAQVGRSPRRFERVSEHDAMQRVVAHTVLADRRQPGQRLFNRDVGRVPGPLFRHAQGQDRVAETGHSNGIGARSRCLLFRLTLLIYSIIFSLPVPDCPVVRNNRAMAAEDQMQDCVRRCEKSQVCQPTTHSCARFGQLSRKLCSAGILIISLTVKSVL